MPGDSEKFEGIVDRKRGQCWCCSRGFPEGDTYHSALFEFERSYTRRDFCRECWAVEAAGFSRDPGAVSHWVAVQRPQEEKDDRERRRLEPDRIEVMFDVLGNACVSSEKAKMNLAYALSLVMARKRLLQMEKGPVREKDGTLYFRERGGDREFFVKDVTLSEPEIDCVMQELEGILGGKFV